MAFPWVCRRLALPMDAPMQPGMEVQGSAVSLLSLHMLNTMRRFYASAGAPAGAEKLGTIHPSWGQLRTHLPPKRASRGPGDGARERSSLYHWVVTCQCSMPAKSYLAGDLTSRDLKTAEDLAEKSDSVSPISFPKRRAFGTSDLCYCPKRTCRLGKSFARETFGDPGRSFARPVVSGIEPP